MYFSDDRVKGSVLIIAVFISVMIALFMLLLIQVKKTSNVFAKSALWYMDIMHLHDEFSRMEFTNERAEGFEKGMEVNGFKVELTSHQHGLWRKSKLSIQKGNEREMRTYLMIPDDSTGNNKFEIRDNNRIIDIGYGVESNSPILIPKGQFKPYKPDVSYNSGKLNLFPSSAYTFAVDSFTYVQFDQVHGFYEEEFLILRDTLNPFDTVRAKVIHIESEAYLQHNLIVADSVYISGDAGSGQFLVRSIKLAPDCSIQFPSLILSYTDSLSHIVLGANSDFRGFIYLYGTNHLVEKPRIIAYNNSKILGDVFTNGSLVKFGNFQLEGRMRLNGAYKINDQGKLFIVDSISINLKNVFQGPYYTPSSERYKTVWYGKN